MREHPLLFLAGSLSCLAALIHLACIAGGGPWYRALGAGEKMARAAESGQWAPALVTLAIAIVFAVWSLYAWSAAGLLPRLPLLRWVLAAITAVYLARGLVFFPLLSYFPGNSPAFWYWSSGICTAIGVIHLFGLWQAWPRLAAS